MKMKMAGLALALAAPMMLAQDTATQPKRTWTPPTPQQMAQRHVEHMTDALSLTPDQAEKATAIMTNQATQTQGLHQQMKAAHEALETAVKANNAAAIQQQSLIIGNLTAQEVHSQSLAHAAIYQILTPEQQQKAQQMLRDHGPMGPGMMMRHRGPGGPDDAKPAPQE